MSKSRRRRGGDGELQQNLAEIHRFFLWGMCACAFVCFLVNLILRIS